MKDTITCPTCGGNLTRDTSLMFDPYMCDCCEHILTIYGEHIPPIMQTFESPSRFNLGDLVTKTKGSEWTGRVVGYYSTALTPVGVCVESAAHKGSVQIYPESAFEAFDYET